MRKIILFAALLIIAISCDKGEVPGNCQKYVGEWKGVNNSASTVYELTIKPDGHAKYQETTYSGYASVEGGVYFDGYNFKIGAKHINKKFKTDSVPHRITISTKPYQYYQRATFNGITYTDRP